MVSSAVQALSAAVDQIDALLPQTQCRQCGFAGCRPYAQAIAAGQASINRCPPGGGAVIEALARLTGQTRLPLDERCGTERPMQVAFVVEPICIGCTKCLQACPVDAISGAAGWLHTVVPALCTGCGLCVAPCPVDCIEMRDPEPPRAWTRADADDARARHAVRARRLAQEQVEREQRLARKALARPTGGLTRPTGTSPCSTQAPADRALLPLAEGSPNVAAPAASNDASAAALARKRAVIEAAVERARRRAAARVSR